MCLRGRDLWNVRDTRAGFSFGRRDATRPYDDRPLFNLAPDKFLQIFWRSMLRRDHSYPDLFELILDGGRVHGGDGRTMKFLDDQWWCIVRQEECQPGICVEVG